MLSNVRLSGASTARRCGSAAARPGRRRRKDGLQYRFVIPGTSAVALSRSGTVFTSISPRARASESARGSATREATLRCGEPMQLPMQLQLWVRIFACNRARGARCRAGPCVGQGHVPGRAMGVLQMAQWWNSTTDLPVVSKCFRRDSSKHPCQRPPCYFAWGCFRYFSWKPEPRRPLQLGAMTADRWSGAPRGFMHYSV